MGAEPLILALQKVELFSVSGAKIGSDVDFD